MSVFLGKRFNDVVLVKMNWPKCKEVSGETGSLAIDDCSLCSYVQQCSRNASKARYESADYEIIKFLTERHLT